MSRAMRLHPLMLHREQKLDRDSRFVGNFRPTDRDKDRGRQVTTPR
jgi:hypothetical protein